MPPPGPENNRALALYTPRPGDEKRAELAASILKQFGDQVGVSAEKYRRRHVLPLTPESELAAGRIVFAAILNTVEAEGELPSSKAEFRKLVRRGLAQRDQLRRAAANVLPRLTLRETGNSSTDGEDLAIPGDVISKAKNEVEQFPLVAEPAATAGLLRLVEERTRQVPVTAAHIAYRQFNFPRPADPALLEWLKREIVPLSQQARVVRGLVAVEILKDAPHPKAKDVDPLLFPIELAPVLAELLASDRPGERRFAASTLRSLELPSELALPARDMFAEYHEQLAAAARRWRKSPVAADPDSPKYWRNLDEMLGVQLPTLPIGITRPLATRPEDLAADQDHLWAHAVAFHDQAIPSLLDIHYGQRRLHDFREKNRLRLATQAWQQLLRKQKSLPHSLEKQRAKLAAIEAEIGERYPQNLASPFEESVRSLRTERTVLRRRLTAYQRAIRTQVKLEKLLSGRDDFPEESGRLTDMFLSLHAQDVEREIGQLEASRRSLLKSLQRPTWLSLFEYEGQSFRPRPSAPGTPEEIDGMLHAVAAFTERLSQEPESVMAELLEGKGGVSPEGRRERLARFLRSSIDDWEGTSPTAQARRKEALAALTSLSTTSASPGVFLKANLLRFLRRDAFEMKTTAEMLRVDLARQEELRKEQEVLNTCQKRGSLKEWYLFQKSRRGQDESLSPLARDHVRMRVLPRDVMKLMSRKDKQAEIQTELARAEELIGLYRSVAGHIRFIIPDPEQLQDALIKAMRKPVKLPSPKPPDQEIAQDPKLRDLYRWAQVSASVNRFLRSLSDLDKERNLFVPLREAKGLTIVQFIWAVESRTTTVRALRDMEHTENRLREIDRELQPLSDQVELAELAEKARLSTQQISWIEEEREKLLPTFLEQMRRLNLVAERGALEKLGIFPSDATTMVE